AVEDQLDALAWAESIGGLPALIKRSEANLDCITEWVEKTSWVDFLAEDPATRSSTSICLKIVDPAFTGQSGEAQAKTIKEVTGLLEAERVAFDCGSYRDAPPGLRIWGGGTVETDDIACLLPWLEWAYEQVSRA
ncbi:MAG: phosphoserine aminotransferase, partial [Pseudomonadales bacterium]|nr:phosphoserine aminotransferase [Pseudomonadales bacterium]